MLREIPVAFALSICLFAWIHPSSTLAAEVDFDSQVRPILSDACFHCHGPDESTRAADLRLDTEEDAFGDLGGYAAFVPHDLEASEALRRILSDDPDERMPPPESKIPLTSIQKQTLKDWVKTGAEWSEHWSFVPPGDPEIPEHPSGWSFNAIDHFIHARAEAAGLSPLAEADRATLIRRVTLDLTGLPPTPEEVDAFLGDHSGDAYESVVDRLIASPSYGERMAWEWLDAARYADTDGFQGDPTRTMWPWRDWLVKALNDNMPFDQFTIEMIAGDLLPDATMEQVLASGFNRNHMFNGEGGRIAEETRVENVFDRAETTSTVWLGLTMTCCRCHDHKYDPISIKEYFQFYAFFNNTSETGRSGRGKTAPVLNYLRVDQRQRREEMLKELHDVQRRLATPIKDLDRKQAAWESETSTKLQSNLATLVFDDWWKLGPVPMAGRKAFDEVIGPEKSVDLSRTVAGLNWVRQSDSLDGKVIDLPDTVGATFFYRMIHSPSERTVQLSLGSDDAIKVFLRGEEVLANYAARPAAADQEKLVLKLKQGDNPLLIKIVNTGGIGGFYFEKRQESALGLPVEIVGDLHTDPEKRQPEQIKRLREYYRANHWPLWNKLSKRRSELKKKLDTLEQSAVTVMVMDELPKDKKRETFILQRGGYDKPTEQSVSPMTPSALPPFPQDAPRNRLTLAKWLVDPSHPLTARVTVNRYWQTFFGRGIVKSTEDFGSQGSRPTHPKLLDYLAMQLIRSGWDVKALHKLIVMSKTYRQSSRLTKGTLERDPSNEWFARAPRYRMPSWMLRDQALAVSGLLNPSIGGRAIKPYQPKGIWAEATFGKIKYKPDSGEDLYRRSLYIFWRRIVGPTMFFDGAKRQTCEVKPTRTNTPMHALTTLNEITFVESARKMAERVLLNSSDNQSRIDYAFRLVTARRPTDQERVILLSRIDQLLSDFHSHPDDATELLSVGESNIAEEIDSAELAAFTVACSILLNMDETLSKQ